jgi:hypothetical protein
LVAGEPYEFSEFYKKSFALTWIAFIMIGYSVLRVDASLKDYPFVFPSLLGFALINILNIGLIYRHFKLKKSLPNPLSPS